MDVTAGAPGRGLNVIPPSSERAMPLPPRYTVAPLPATTDSVVGAPRGNGTGFQVAPWSVLRASPTALVSPVLHSIAPAPRNTHDRGIVFSESVCQVHPPSIDRAKRLPEKEVPAYRSP